MTTYHGLTRAAQRLIDVGERGTVARLLEVVGAQSLSRVHGRDYDILHAAMLEVLDLPPYGPREMVWADIDPQPFQALASTPQQ
jgi:hypothetical protein